MSLFTLTFLAVSAVEMLTNLRYALTPTLTTLPVFLKFKSILLPHSSDMLLELLSVRSGASRFTSETIHNDLDTFIDFIAMVN